MEKPATDNTELVDYNDEEDAQVTATALPEPQDSVKSLCIVYKHHFQGTLRGSRCFWLSILLPEGRDHEGDF